MNSSSSKEVDAVPCPICSSSSYYSFSGRDLCSNQHVRYDYNQCSACGIYFLHPMPDAQTVASFYPENYVAPDNLDHAKRVGLIKQANLRLHHNYKHLHSGAWANLLASTVAFLYKQRAINYVPNGKLLDVGCGNGRFLRTMRSMGWNTYGVEFNKNSVDFCRSTHLSVHHGDLASAHFESESFDVITVRHVIEHIPAPNVFMRELAKLLKPGGQLFIETPNFSSFGWSWFTTNWYACGLPRHLMLFSPNNLTLLAEKHGLVPTDHFLETTPKLFLNTLDTLFNNEGTPSRRIRWRRLLARWYVWFAQKNGRGDIIHSTFMRPL